MALKYGVQVEVHLPRKNKPSAVITKVKQQKVNESTENRRAARVVATTFLLIS